MNPINLLTAAFLMAYLGCVGAQSTIPPASVFPPAAGRTGDPADPLGTRNPGSAPMLDISIDRGGISLPRGVEDRRPEQEPRDSPAPPPATRIEGPGVTPPKSESR